MDTPRTMLDIAGAPRTASLAAGATALIVIDFQYEYFDGLLALPDAAHALAAARRLVEHADAKGMPVVMVQHLPVNPASVLFTPGGRNGAIHADILPRAHHTLVTKTTPSCFVGTGLDVALSAQGIRQVVICGLMTHMCISTSARDCVRHGLSAIVAADACATRDLPGHDGGVVPHDLVHRATLAALSDRFADILSTDALIALPIA